MPHNHKVEIDMLGKKISSVSDALARLGQSEDLRKLILEMRRPGFTTPAEFLLLSGIVDAMDAQVAGLTKLKGDLIKGSAAVVGA
jgi:hypothetical protein